ncbi:hypothetical protein RhiirA4_488538 [Rhizophagus irregularis]|uniref:Uncharacterized protein n=1 Tax=Rhizophagus irregularis TaxID=588596 RepID=A0A2I1HTS6_9GLOM|nr:hypothetical protein RhiirA4_488538 [Rhizophagus irregularis]
MFVYFIAMLLNPSDVHLIELYPRYFHLLNINTSYSSVKLNLNIDKNLNNILNNNEGQANIKINTLKGEIINLNINIQEGIKSPILINNYK